MQFENIVYDTGYVNEENCKYLENHNLNSYIKITN